MSDRKIIFKCKTGSHLYGTNHPLSDQDFQGVFLPSSQDLLSLDKCPDEWTENVKTSSGTKNTQGDIDCKYFSLQKFLRLAAQGQPSQLEMLFAPPEMILISTPEWKKIIENRELFISKKGISPFIGFALAQSHRATIKGENLREIRNLIEWGKSLTNQSLNSPMRTLLSLDDDTDKALILVGKNEPDIYLRYLTNDHGFLQLRVAGRDFDINIKTKDFLKGLKKLEDRYGARVQAASQTSYDYKSLGHAVRLLGEAKEFLSEGYITLPRPDAEYLRTILRGTIDDSNIDWFDLLQNEITLIRKTIEPTSPLPEQANRKKINKLCQEILKKHILE